jgi:hypothetical protein
MSDATPRPAHVCVDPSGTQEILAGVDPADFQGVYMRGEDDCLAAVIASVLGLELDALPAILPRGAPVESWADWRAWLRDERQILLESWSLAERPGWTPEGWWLAAYTAEHVDFAHALAFYGSRFVWDPAPGFGPRQGTIGRVVAGYALGSSPVVFKTQPLADVLAKLRAAT